MADTIKPVVTSQLMTQVLTFHRLRNRAIGVSQDTQFERGLAWAANEMREQEKQQGMAAAAFWQGSLQQYQVEIKRLIAEADSAEKRREILPTVQQLYRKAHQAQQQLEALNNGG